jgi:hypothetical protein
MRTFALLFTLVVPSLAFATSATDLVGSWQVDEAAAVQAQKAAEKAGNENAWVIKSRVTSHTVLRFDGKALFMEVASRDGKTKKTDKLDYKVASINGDKVTLTTTDAKNHADTFAFRVNGKKLFWVEDGGLESPFLKQ